MSLRSVNLERENRKSDANVTGVDTTNIGGGRSGSIARGNESPESPVRGQTLPHGCDYTPRHSPPGHLELSSARTITHSSTVDQPILLKRTAAFYEL